MYVTTVIIRKEIYIMLLFSDNSKPPERMGRKAKGPQYSVLSTGSPLPKEKFFCWEKFFGYFSGIYC